MKSKSYQFAAFKFSDTENAPFSVKAYSRMKFGSDYCAKKFGVVLADKFFAKHKARLLAAEGVVVIPSPYNFVKNAATIMTKHFVDRLNVLMVNENGFHVEYSTIHRKLSYVRDYGHLDKETRKSLLDGDQFYINSDFYKGKVLIFVDDVIITGTHEDKLKEIMARENINNDTFFVYLARYMGDRPEIEGEINFAAMSDLNDYLTLSREIGHHVIVRPLKFLLSQPKASFSQFLDLAGYEKISEIYHGCLGEGYYRIPAYQENFREIQKRI